LRRHCVGSRIGALRSSREDGVRKWEEGGSALLATKGTYREKKRTAGPLPEKKIMLPLLRLRPEHIPVTYVLARAQHRSQLKDA
jgi:hypothetical protein